jgi:hypothetical protein
VHLVKKPRPYENIVLVGAGLVSALVTPWVHLLSQEAGSLTKLEMTKETPLSWFWKRG